MKISSLSLQRDLCSFEKRMVLFPSKEARYNGERSEK
jgi:hypothetical protein